MDAILKTGLAEQVHNINVKLASEPFQLSSDQQLNLQNRKKSPTDWAPKIISPVWQQICGADHVEPSSHQLLEIIISFTSAKNQADEIVCSLMAYFGSIGAVLTAPPSKLLKVLNGRADCVALLKSIHKCMVFALRAPVEDGPVFQKWSDLEAYLRVSLSHEHDEVVRLLFLDTRNALLLDEEHARGTVNHTPVYPRNIVIRVLETRATALIIVHNHPSGDPTPSDADIEMTQVLAQVLDCIGVKLHDHVIVGRHRCESLRRLGFMS